MGSFWGSVQLLVLGVCGFFPVKAVVANMQFVASAAGAGWWCLVRGREEVQQSVYFARDFGTAGRQGE